MKIFLMLNGQERGPFGLSQVRKMWRMGDVNDETLYWYDGLSEWLPLETMSVELDGPAVGTQSTAPRVVMVHTGPEPKRGVSMGVSVFGGILMAVLVIWLGLFTLSTCSAIHSERQQSREHK